MDTSLTIGDPDLHMPGGYSETTAISTRVVDATPVPAEPIIPPRRTQRVPARFQDILPKPPIPVPAPPPKLPTVYLMVTNLLKTVAQGAQKDFLT